MLNGTPISLLKLLIVFEELFNTDAIMFVVEVLPLLPVMQIILPIRSNYILEIFFKVGWSF